MHAGKIKFKPIPFDIGVVLKDVVALYRVPCENKQLHIGVDSSSRSYVYADKEMIATVIRNLLNNAVKFSHRGGKIDIIVHSYEDKIYVCVRDYGLGMSLQQVESLRQENYYTSSIGTQGESGNGLGLIICKDFLIRNGSKLLIESRLGEGSELSFELNKVSALLV